MTSLFDIFKFKYTRCYFTKFKFLKLHHHVLFKNVFIVSNNEPNIKMKMQLHKLFRVFFKKQKATIQDGSFHDY